MKHHQQPRRIDQAGLFGAYFPFVKMTAARAGTTDLRLSLQERYIDQAGYVDADAAIVSAATNLVLP